MQLEQILADLLKDMDTSSEIGRRKAYLAVIDYADAHIPVASYNHFLAMAAEQLGQPRLMRDLIPSEVRTDGKERISVRFDEVEGCQVIANASGCLYLSRIFRALSQAEQVGEHVHFAYQQFPLEAGSYPVTCYLEDDAYLDTLPTDPVMSPYGDPPVKPRVIDPEDIVGFFVTEYIPDNLLCTINRVYPVLSWHWMEEEEDVWKREIREDHSRMVVFVFRRDDGQKESIALDLDDDFVGYVTRDEVMALLLRD